MAKKKKTTKKPSPQKEPSLFIRQLLAILLFVVAGFLFLGGFSVGGPLPEHMFEGASWLIGGSAYLLPVLLIYLGIVKSRTEEKIIPVRDHIGTIVSLIFFSAWFNIAFSNEITSRGGEIGAFVGESTLKLVDRLPAATLYLLMFLSVVLFVFSASNHLLTMLRGLISQKGNDEDTDLADLVPTEKHPTFTLNEGVPVEHHNEAKDGSSQRSTFRNSVQKLSKEENHEALTTTSDPDWQFPSTSLLNQKQDKADPGDVKANAETIKDTLSNFNIEVDMEGANVGPRVTQYTLKPPAGVKLSKITALESNIALDLGAHTIRMEAPIPGKKAVGIEVPNVKSATVRVAGLLRSSEWATITNPLGIVIGRDISGLPIVAALDKMPHLLVAGQTGSGKSVMINALLTSLLYRNSPNDLKLILVDPKQVEMAPYQDIPHLLTPVITEPEKCISALKWAVAEMERRYRTLAENKKRNISEYNMLFPEGKMPYIVIVIDELADLMMVAARDVEALIVRLAQKARAVGIHLVLATQRPSVDVITGLIKANVPARIAFTVNSQVDSRTIIDGVGAEKLLGMGDMLFSTADMPKPKRVQGALITDDETIKITDFLRMQRPPQYDDEVVSQPVQLNGRGGIVVEHSDGLDADDDMFKDAVRAVIEARKASTSLLQRRLRIGYGRAARLIETMEEQGIIGPADGSRPREVLIHSIDELYSHGDDVNADSYDNDDETF